MSNKKIKAEYSVFIAQPRDKEFSGFDRALNYAPAYYDTYSTDVGCAIGNRIRLPDNQLLSVLLAVADEKNPNVLIFQHGGSSEGLRFDVGDVKHSPGWAKMAALLLLLELRLAWRAAKDSNKRADWEALSRRIPAAPLKQLWWGYPREVLGVITNTNRYKPEELRSGSGASDADIKDEVEERAKLWRDSLLGVLEVSREEARPLVTAMQAVHKVGIERLELRACSVGADESLVELIGRFFGAKTVRASKKMLFMGRLQPALDATFPGFEKRRTERTPDSTKPMSEAERRRVLSESYGNVGAILGLLPPPPPMVHPCPVAATAYLVKRMNRPLDFSYLYEFRFLPGDEDEVYFGGTFGAEFTLATESRRAMVAFVAEYLEMPRYGTGWILLGDPIPFHFIREGNSAPVFSGDAKYQDYLVTVTVR